MQKLLNQFLLKVNERITDNTIIVFSKISIGNDISINDLNNVIKDLYETDFFKDVSVKV